jgi:hypothetical protein
MSILKSVSKKALTAGIAVALVIVMAVGAFAGVVATKVYSEPQLTPTADTHLLPGRYRNAPNYFFAAKTLANGSTVYTAAKHGDNLINSYEINDDGSIEILLQTGKVSPPYGPSVSVYFTSFGIVTGYDEDGFPIIGVPLLEQGDAPESGIYEITIPAAYATIGSPIEIGYTLSSSATPPAHPSTAFLILNPELVQVAYTDPIPATFPIEDPEE